jgi:NAD(P)-dependent dehydrogenase (short-subunit alcohol dehydrogenase family)
VRLHVQAQRRCLILPGQNRRAPHGFGFVDHRQFVGQLRRAQSHTGALCGDQGRNRELLRHLAELLGDKGIRVNSVAPGPIWTPLIPSSMPSETVTSLGENTPLGHVGQPAELAPVYVLHACVGGSYIWGSRSGDRGRPIL